ncbi:ABC transporter ATP-binding protein [Paenibacillus xylanexedens]|uniref:ATP-binding cassette subfamily B protein n=1 Tax=Paenibacillus xylanexedens TaxID=528191 RepID=A0ABS4RTP5_PAEXY|nr:ABC transporter ATP-binding protein [Paenibacillus xylanexedens]MBP2245831.1 ATP-binding cassette subfamily B protein [Paenibacillus xylanexedens]
MLKKNIFNILLIVVKIFRKNKLVSSLVLVIPLISGLLTFFSYNAQVKLIDIVTMGSKNYNLSQVFELALIPVLLYVGVAAIQNLLASITEIVKNKMNASITISFQSDIIDIANSIDYENFDDEQFTNKLQRAKNFVGEDLDGITGFLVSSVGIISSLFSIIWLSATSGYYLISLLIFIMIIVTLSIRLFSEVKVRKVGREITLDGRMGDYLSKSLEEHSTLREMKIYRSVDYFIDLWKGTMKKQHNKRYGARKFEIKTGMIVALIQTGTIYIVLVYLLKGIKETNSVSIGTVAVLFLALLTCGNKIMSLTWPLSKLYISSSKLYDLNEVLELKKNIIKESNTNKKTLSLTPIDLTNIYFKYKNSEEFILSNINMRINHGEKIAIVGENGAGKSTLIKLILGQYKSTLGTVLWNGNDKPQGKVSVVFQNFIKFELSLRENIILGNVEEEIDDDKIIMILEKCELMDLYHELGGLDVKLGQIYEGGRQLSGGQWQKLAIARALYNNADLIILDEPTSAIDPISELQIYQKLLELCEDKTAIFISHRLGWTKNVDRIFVIENGSIVEVGNHNDLISHNGIYANMFSLQASWYK